MVSLPDIHYYSYRSNVAVRFQLVQDISHSIFLFIGFIVLIKGDESGGYGISKLVPVASATCLSKVHSERPE